jgi:hypothetical protein
MLDALATTDADRQQAKLCTAALQKKMMELTSTPYVPGPLPEVFPKPPGWPLPASSWDTSHQDIKATLQSLAEKCIAEANGELAEPAADVPVEVPASRP